MAIQTRSSVLAIKVETTEGTPVSPTAGTDAVALQDDFSMTPEFEVLENAELKSSLGASKSILGLENPAASISHYLRHSGTEGDAPNYGDLLQAAFGTEDDAGVEHNTVAASTVSVVNVDTGEGATYQKGQALLVKHPANAYEIRPVESISSDALTLGFDLAVAPGTGVDLGEAITYLPANSGHQTLSIWNYIGNQTNGAIQLMSGSRVVDLAITFEAGQLINATYSLEGVEYFFDPIEITSTGTFLDFTSDNGTFAAQITAQMYKDPHELASAVQTALNAADPLETFTCVYSNSTGIYTIATSTSTVLSLLWSTGANAANTVGDELGYSTGADDTGSTSYAADSAQDFSFPFTASFDSADPLAAKNNEVLIGSSTDITCFEASSVAFTMGTPKTDILSVCAASGKSGSVINAREVSVEVVALLKEYDAEQFKRFRSNEETRFVFNFGSKTSGNWDAGKSGCLYLPTATISSFEITSEENLATLNMTLTGFVNDSAESEVALSFV